MGESLKNVLVSWKSKCYKALLQGFDQVVKTSILIRLFIQTVCSLFSHQDRNVVHLCHHCDIKQSDNVPPVPRQCCQIVGWIRHRAGTEDCTGLGNIYKLCCLVCLISVIWICAMEGFQKYILLNNKLHQFLDILELYLF